MPAFLTGSFNEMRIYNNVQTDTDIVINAIAGADTIVALTDKTFNVATGDWNTGANWTPAGAPTITHRAVIGSARTATVAGAPPAVGSVAINSGTVTIGSGATLQATYTLDLLPVDATTATVNLNGGGRLRVAAVTANASLGAKTINIDNGTIEAGFASSVIQPNIAANIGAGGATIDTGANTMTWTMTAATATPTLGLAGTGNVTKIGSGQLNLFTTTPADRVQQNPSFMGEFHINAGTVDIAGNSGVFGRAGTRSFGKVTMNNSTMLVNTGGGTAREFGADLNVVGNNVISNTNAAVRELRMQGSIAGSGTLRFRKPNVAAASGLDFEIFDLVAFPNVTNAGFTGRIVIEGNYALRFRSAVANSPIDFPNAILELADTGSWVGKRRPRRRLDYAGRDCGIRRCGECRPGARPRQPRRIFLSPVGSVHRRLRRHNQSVDDVPDRGASQNAEFRGIIQDNQAANTPDTVAIVKVGANTQIFSGPNTYSRTTTVNGGTLLVNGTHSMSTVTTLPVGDYTVNTGGTLGGTGTIGTAGDPVNVNVVGGTLAPGAAREL